MAGFQSRRGHDTCSGEDQNAQNVRTLWRPPGHFTSLPSVRRRHLIASFLLARTPTLQALRATAFYQDLKM